MSDDAQPQQPDGPDGPAGHSGPGRPDGPDGPDRAVQGWAPRPDRSEERRNRRTGMRRLVPGVRLVVGAFVGTILVLVAGFLVGYLLVDVPEANADASSESNVFLYSDGSQLARDGSINRENIPLDDVPEHVQHAVLAAEDRDFYDEAAVDPQAMARGAFNTVTGKGRQSGSTITQQYVKNYYLGQEQTVTRKLKELFIAVKIDRQQSKQKILEGYLNTSFFGRNAYGIQAAAQAYYGVPAKKLTPAQGAYLASLLNAPSVYDVAAHPDNKERAVARWEYVLDGMAEHGWMSKSERAKAEFPTPGRPKDNTGTGMAGQRGYIVQAVKEYLTSNDIIAEEDLSTGGHRITTTLDKDKQQALAKAVKQQLLSKTDDDRKADRNVRAGGVAIDPKNGQVLAMYGGVDFLKQYVNNATRRDYQVGSSFKPFVFTAAVEHESRTQDGRRINPNTSYDGTSSRSVQGWTGEAYNPENEDKKSYGNISVKEATDKSVNAVYAQMAADVGPEKVLETAVALGIPKTTPDLHASPSMALGTATASPLDMAEAYATLANHGKHHPHSLVTKITKPGQDDVDIPRPKATQAVSRAAADTTTSVLRGVVESGTGTAAQSAGRPAAGKTGTAEEDTAAWFAGYTPGLSTVVSVMGQDPDKGGHTPLYGALGQSRINGGGFPAAIWGQFTESALKGTPAKKFDLRLAPGAARPDKSRPDDDPSGSPSDDPSGSEEGDDGTDTSRSPDGSSEDGTYDEDGTDSGEPTGPGRDTGPTGQGDTDSPSDSDSGTGDNYTSPDSPSGGAPPFWRPDRFPPRHLPGAHR